MLHCTSFGKMNNDGMSDYAVPNCCTGLTWSYSFFE